MYDVLISTEKMRIEDIYNLISLCFFYPMVRERGIFSNRFSRLNSTVHFFLRSHSATYQFIVA